MTTQKKTLETENVVSLDTVAPGSDFVGKGPGVIPTEIAKDLQASVESLQKSALAELGDAHKALLAAERKLSSFYGHVIKATMKCLQAGLTRAAIAAYLLDHSDKNELEVNQITYKFTSGRTHTEESSPGRVSKYVKMAQWSMGKYSSGEQKPESVMLMGRAFKTPIEALEANHVSYSAVYTAWRNATASEIDLSDWGSDIETAAFNAAPDFAFTVRQAKLGENDEKTEEKARVRVTDSRRAIRGALRGLLGSTAAKALPIRDKLMLAQLLGVKGEISEVDEDPPVPAEEKEAA